MECTTSPTKPAATRLIISGGANEGHGNSTILSFVIDWLRVKHPGIEMKVYDLDHSHRTLTRMYGMPGGGGEFTAAERHRLVPISLVGPDGLTVLAEVTKTIHESDISIIDGVGSFDEGFEAWTRSSGFRKAQEKSDFRVTYLLPVTDQASTGAQALRTMKSHGPDADYLVVKRQLHQDVISIWDREGSLEARERAASLGACVISIHELDTKTVSALKGDEWADLLSTPAPTLYALTDGRGNATAR